MCACQTKSSDSSDKTKVASEQKTTTILCCTCDYVLSFHHQNGRVNSIDNCLEPIGEEKARGWWFSKAESKPFTWKNI